MILGNVAPLRCIPAARVLLLIMQLSFTTSVPNVRTFTAHKHAAKYTNIPIVSFSSRARLHNSFGHIVHVPTINEQLF